MRIYGLIGGLCIAAAAASLGWTSPAGAEAESYQVDTVHSFVHFKVRHFGVGNVWGRFNQLTGSVAVNDADPAKSSIQVEVKTDSLDTGNQKRDQHLKGPDFFNVKQFPAISFKSKEVKKEGEAYQVAGDLTLHGVTKPLTVKVERLGAGKDPMGGVRAGYETTFTVKRSEFGMSTMVGPVGDEVQLTVSAEAVKK
jgi:polyisoprenoid-binding protein YceI